MSWQALADSSSYQWHSSSLTVSTDMEVSIHKVKPVDRAVLAKVLWLPSEYGILQAEKSLAEELTQFGIESWFVDFYEAMFLAPTESALLQIEPVWMQNVVQQWHQQNSDYPGWIIAANQAAKLALQSVQKIQSQGVNNLGLVLINPNLYVKTPQPGLKAEYILETENLNMPVAVIQAQLSPWKWRLTELLESLQQSGSDVFTMVIPGVRDRFYFRPDALPIENSQAARLFQETLALMQLQESYMKRSRMLAEREEAVVFERPEKSNKNLALQAYQGEQGLALRLADLSGNFLDLQDYKGKVVLVNFWASWCPPCVHEIPSMNRLKEGLAGQPFEILAVNLGEEKTQVSAFAKRFKMSFPVLLDETGEAVQSWRVFAYPSSFVIDKNGKIDSALFGAVEWDAPEFRQQLMHLIEKTEP